MSDESLRDFLLQAVSDSKADFVLPSESLITALGSRIHAIADRLPCGPDPTRLQRFIEKYELFWFFLESGDLPLRAHLPPTALLQQGVQSPAAFYDLKPPLFVKVDARNGHTAKVTRFATHKEAEADLPDLLLNYGKCVAQQWVPGRGVGVFFCVGMGRSTPR